MYLMYAKIESGIAERAYKPKEKCAEPEREARLFLNFLFYKYS